MPHVLHSCVPSPTLLSLCLLFLLLLYTALSVTMRFYHFPAALSSLALLASSTTAQSTNSFIDLSWHEPISSQINNLTFAINASGVYGFVFDSSNLPANVSYGKSNNCQPCVSLLIIFEAPITGATCPTSAPKSTLE